MKRNKIIKTVSAMFALACVTLASCHNDKEEDGILRPIGTYLVGTWNQSTCLLWNADKNNWEATEEPERPFGRTFTFAADGNFRATYTSPEGWQLIQDGIWKPEEDKGGYTGIYGELVHFAKINRLSDYELELPQDEVRDDKGNVMKGSFRYILYRLPDVTFVEKVEGKWTLGKTCEKVDGEWRETTFAMPDEAWCDLKSNGIFTLYGKYGDKEQKSEGKWFFNATTKQRRLQIDGMNFDQSFNMVDDNTMEIFYSTNADPVTGEVRKGEFKDVMVR